MKKAWLSPTTGFRVEGEVVARTDLAFTLVQTESLLGPDRFQFREKRFPPSLQERSQYVPLSVCKNSCEPSMLLSPGR